MTQRPLRVALVTRRAWIALLCLSACCGCSTSRFAFWRPKSESAEQLAQRARVAANAGDADAARSLLTAAVDRNPGDCETRLALSEMLLEHGSLAGATEHLRELVERSPDDPRGYVLLAGALTLQEDDAGAEQALDKAQELDPVDPSAWIQRARLEQRRARPAQALAACYRALAAAPQHAEARLLASEIHVQQESPQQAIPLLRSLLEDASGCPLQRREARWLLGRCYARTGRWSDAAPELAGAIAERGGAANDWYQVAYAWYRVGDREAARQAVAEALRREPASAEALALSRILQSEGVRTASATEADRGPVAGPDVAGPPVITQAR